MKSKKIDNSLLSKNFKNYKDLSVRVFFNNWKSAVIDKRQRSKEVSQFGDKASQISNGSRRKIEDINFNKNSQ